MDGIIPALSGFIFIHLLFGVLAINWLSALFAVFVLFRYIDKEGQVFN